MSDHERAEGSAGFRRLPRQHARLDGLDLYARIVERTGDPIHDERRIDAALAKLRSNLLDVTDAESTLHGWRVQALFEAVVASLGRVQLIKLEDAGDVFFSGANLKPPDFRIVTSGGEQFLVDVKSFHQKKPEDVYRLRRKDMDELQRYSDLVGVGALKFAIYWSRWNLWTLTSARRFQAAEGNYRALALPEAVKASEMGAIGDRIPATEWPIGMTLYSDPDHPRRVSADGEAPFTIGGVDYTVAGRVVTKSAEQRIVHRLMLYGGWPEDTSVEVVGDDLISASFLFSPEELPPAQQHFAFHGALSSIFSAMFNEATMSEQGEITELRISIDPSALASLIPDDYEGEVLRLWTIHQHSV